MMPPPGSGNRLNEAARSLAVDRMSVEVLKALESAGLEALLMKGPAIAARLYGPGEHRPYVDCDLLIPAASESRVSDVLRDLGFTPDPGFGVPDPGVADQHEWHRGTDHVDLHGSLVGVGIRPSDVWPILSGDCDFLTVTNHQVRIFGRSS